MASSFRRGVQAGGGGAPPGSSHRDDDAGEKSLHAASLSQALPRLTRLDLQRSIGTQQRAIERLTQAVLEFVLSDPLLARHYCSSPFPAPVPPAPKHTLAELTLLPADMDLRQWVASASLDPRK